MLRRWTPMLPVAALITGACGTSEDDTLLILAAASLTDAFEELEFAFEQANPGIDVEVSAAGSSALRLQIDQGAPADVVAVANEEVMAQLAGEGHVAIPTVFATNQLVVATSSAGAAVITGPDDLADPSLLIGLCAVDVPCGRYAADALALAGIEPSVDTYENDVRALTAKLAIGELDAGVVYATDVTALADDLVVVAALDGVEARYPIAPLVDAPHGEDAKVFVDFVLSDAGQSILRDAGFTAP